MNPVKARSAIDAAYRNAGVRHFVVDHPTELGKLAEILGRDPEVTVVVRMTTSATGAAIHLSDKFGAGLAMAAEILAEAVALGFRPGLGFHVGSQCTVADAYRAALANAADVADAAGVRLHCLDVGGGFPASYPGSPAPPLAAFVEAIREGLAALDLAPDAEILAEPGRALVAQASTLITRVQLRKGGRLYINDGVYGSLSEAKLAGIPLPARLIRPDGAPASERRAFELAGPTCDSLDILPDPVTLPADADEGDWIAIDALGAYSTALATDFNGCQPETFIEVADEPPAGE
jgi:ornithine decarboxylase